MSTPSAHDGVFRTFLGDPATAREFLELYLPKQLADYCDLSTLRLESGSFVEPDLKQHVSDILYSMNTTTGGTGYVYALVEHQSTPDPKMTFRMMRYVMAVMGRHLEKGNRRLPLVIPFLFYHGKDSPYPHSMNWLDLFEQPELARKIYNQPFPLIDVTDISDDTIMQHRRMGVLELVQKHIHTRDMLELAENIALLLELGMCSQEQTISLLRYIADKGETSDPDLFMRKLIQGAPSHQEEIVGTIAQHFRQEGIELGEKRGMEKGRQEGRQEGIQEGKRAVARTLLMNGASVEMVMQATGLTEQELKQLNH